MHFTLICALLGTISAVPALAQFGGGRGGGGGGFFNHGGGNAPNTFVTVASSAPAAATSAAAPPPATSSSSTSSGSSGTSGVSAALVPPYGITAGIKAPDGTANCVGDGGKDIPCDCPPSLDTFVAGLQVQVGNGMPFPTSNSVADQLTRLETCIITLQNFVGGPGSGVGCPAVSTTWKELQSQLQSEA